MVAALEEIESIYLEDVGRLPTQGEVADLIAFVTNGCLVPMCGAVAHPFTKATSADDETPRAEQRGFRGALGPRADGPPGTMRNVDPTTGEHVKRKDGK